MLFVILLFPIVNYGASQVPVDFTESETIFDITASPQFLCEEIGQYDDR